jgi:hypothetical protein
MPLTSRRKLIGAAAILAIAVLVGLTWVISSNACIESGGWIDYHDRVCFTASGSRPLQEMYFVALLALALLAGAVGAGFRLAHSIRRSLRRAA